MRAFEFFRRSARRLVFKRTSDPDTLRNTSRLKKFTGSYSDLIKLPSSGGMDLNGGGMVTDPKSAMLHWMMDFDVLP